MRVMVIGASTNRDKFGNKCVRAYRQQGHTVLPVNPRADEIEGIKAWADAMEPPGPIDRASFYLPPQKSIPIMDQLANRGDVDEVWLNPGAESDELLDHAQKLGLNVITACSIVDIGVDPAQL